MFYHLTRSTAEATARSLLARAVGQGWPVMLRGTDAARLARLDDWLWTESDEGFLPHGLEGGPHDARQPVLIGRGAAANGARAFLLVDGATVSEAEARGAERLWLLFDGQDPAAVEAARGEWRRLTDLGLAAQYWSEESGRWAMKIEKAAAQGAPG
ncbi:MAG: DNA polymerase III subunit chi [Paracoccaceae bacterium]|nr:MAG: DNA polymerase III subunit chi [Paracoccaceae bacterium]